MKQKLDIQGGGFGHALKALYVLPLVALALACSSRTAANNKTAGTEEEEVAAPPVVTLNGLAISTVTVEDILRTFGEPDSIDLIVSRVEDGDIHSGLVLDRSFSKNGFADFMKLSTPADKDYYRVRFHYADSYLAIATPEITEMTENGGIPMDLSFADYFAIDSFSICSPDWVLGNEKGSVSIGDSLEELQKISLELVPLGDDGTAFAFAPSVTDDNLWSVEANDGKITKLSYEGASWI